MYTIQYGIVASSCADFLGGPPGMQPSAAVQHGAAWCGAASGYTPSKVIAGCGPFSPHNLPAAVSGHLQRLGSCGRGVVARRPSRLSADDRSSLNDQAMASDVPHRPDTGRTTPAEQGCSVPQVAGVRPPTPTNPPPSHVASIANTFATMTGVAAGITWQQQQQPQQVQACSAPLLRPWLKWVCMATRLLLWRAWATLAPDLEQQRGSMRVWMATVCLPILQAVPGLLAAAWRSWGTLQQGPVKAEGLALLLAQPGGLPALTDNQRLLLTVAQQVAPLQASPATSPLTTWLAASPSFHQLLAQQPALMDTYLLELGRWSQRRLVHQCAAWKVLAAVPRCLLVPLAQQRLHSSDRRVVVGAGVALTQL